METVKIGLVRVYSSKPVFIKKDPWGVYREILKQ